MNSRDDILTRIRKGQPASRPLPEIPTFDQGLSTSIETFKAALLRMGGRFVDPPTDGNLDAQIRGLFPDAKVICSAVPEVKGNRPIEQVRSPQELDDVDVGVVRALFGVAETGSLWLSEAQYKIDAIGFLAQHLVVLLDPDAIVANMHLAYRHEGFFDGAVRRLHDGSIRDRRHRRRADPRCPGHPDDDGHSRARMTCS